MGMTLGEKKRRREERKKERKEEFLFWWSCGIFLPCWVYRLPVSGRLLDWVSVFWSGRCLSQRGLALVPEILNTEAHGAYIPEYIYGRMDRCRLDTAYVNTYTEYELIWTD